MSQCPISLDGKTLIIRYGLFNPLIVPIDNIATIRQNEAPVRRQRGLKRYKFAGHPNVAVGFIEPLAGTRSIYLGVDNAQALISAVRKRQHTLLQ